MFNSQCLFCLLSLCSSINFTAKLCSCTSDCGEQSCCTTGTYIRARNMNYITMIYNYSHFRSCTTNKYQLYLYMSFSLEKQSCHSFLFIIMWLNTRTAAIIVGNDNQSHNNETTSNTDNNNLSKVQFVCYHIAYKQEPVIYIHELRALITEFMLEAHGTSMHNTPFIAHCVGFCTILV